MNLNKLLTASLLATAVTGAFAGAVGSSNAVVKTGSIQIDTDNNGSNDYNLDVSNLLSFNASTGALTLNLAATLPAANNEGQWNTGSYVLNNQTYNGLAWHNWVKADGTVDVGGTATTSNPWATTLVLRMDGNVDPEMNYGFSVKNNGAATQAYTITFGESLVPAVSGAYSVQADLAGAVSSVLATQGVTVTPNTTSGLMQELYLRQVSNGAVVNAGVNVGPSFTTPLLGSVNYPAVSSALVNGGLGCRDL